MIGIPYRSLPGVTAAALYPSAPLLSIPGLISIVGITLYWDLNITATGIWNIDIG